MDNIGIVQTVDIEPSDGRFLSVIKDFLGSLQRFFLEGLDIEIDDALHNVVHFLDAPKDDIVRRKSYVFFAFGSESGQVLRRCEQIFGVQFPGGGAVVNGEVRTFILYFGLHHLGCGDCSLVF
jgi:hypothetical protein